MTAGGISAIGGALFVGSYVSDSLEPIGFASMMTWAAGGAVALTATSIQHILAVRASKKSSSALLHQNETDFSLGLSVAPNALLLSGTF